MKTTTLLLATPILLAFTQTPSGQASYEANCRKCHGARGVAPKVMVTKFPKITTFDAVFFAKRTDDSVIAIMTKGGATADMKSFKDKMSRDQMKEVATYIRSFAK